MIARLYRTTRGAMLEVDGQCFELPGVSWDEIFRRPDPTDWLLEKRGRESTSGGCLPSTHGVDAEPASPSRSSTAGDLLPPIAGQEVWAAGVTYYRSRSARMEESSHAGSGDFYDRVYSAPRPELFFKASPHRVVGHGGQVRIRSDAAWNVPEPELTACVSAAGDESSRL